MPRFSRRAFLEFSCVAGAASLLGSIRGSASSDLRLERRPRTPRGTIDSGEHPLGLGGQRDGILYVPGRSTHETPLPLLVMLHGAGNRAQGMAHMFPLAEEFGVVMLAPDSRRSTWDAILDAVTPPATAVTGDGRSSNTAANDRSDARFIDEALGRVFDRCPIDPTRVSVGGFSDGASYALSLGLSNGDFFNAVVAFSPGFVPRFSPLGKPRLFVSHGTDDTVLPIDRAGRVVARRLKDDQYDVTYVEFPGGHTVPPAIARDAFAWLSRK